ncbi:hypothetical protein K469DRAFT_698357 [Zopfia rhizophila CBS 207.26]|uniref:Uncharacterized protein n=1 Tax=Zopfia rhizophila CBS 207.26 TaxID=1314779 RepID=A0A6A6DAU8_9PEZI|nr:hypothetical protein K469DRAFT_698357 [Zopfia rhizophila CBS 207.26]
MPQKPVKISPYAPVRNGTNPIIGKPHLSSDFSLPSQPDHPNSQSAIEGRNIHPAVNAQASTIISNPTEITEPQRLHFSVGVQDGRRSMPSQSRGFNWRAPSSRSQSLPSILVESPYYHNNSTLKRKRSKTVHFADEPLTQRPAKAPGKSQSQAISKEDPAVSFRFLSPERTVLDETPDERVTARISDSSISTRMEPFIYKGFNHSPNNLGNSRYVSDTGICKTDGSNISTNSPSSSTNSSLSDPTVNSSASRSELSISHYTPPPTSIDHLLLRHQQSTTPEPEPKDQGIVDLTPTSYLPDADTLVRNVKFCSLSDLEQYRPPFPSPGSKETCRTLADEREGGSMEWGWVRRRTWGQSDI